MEVSSDEQAMALAVELSRKGMPAPNPHVGCVIVNNGRIVGQGWHDHAGGPHAEANALAEAGPLARDAAAFVTLEPCSHFGRTPPCSQALANAGVKRVVFAVKDPNPKAAGGAEDLIQRGIKVESGLMAAEAEEANRKWLTAVSRKWPYTVLKAGISLDGRVALENGESQWITGDEARRRGRLLRAECGAVLVGAGTAEMDNPLLSIREEGIVNQPVRVVLDPKRRLPDSLNVFQPGQVKTLRVTGSGLSQGTQTYGKDIECPVDDSGQFDVHQLLRLLFAEGITGLLVEGGAKTLGGFIQSGAADELHLFMAGKVLLNGPSWAQGTLSSLAGATRWTLETVERIGDQDCSDLEMIWLPKVN